MTCITVAMYHGNLEMTEQEIHEARSHMNSGRLARLVERRRGAPEFQDRTIVVDAHITPQGARFVIQDDGHGFDLPASTRSDGECFEQGRGRGLMLIRSLMDEASYNDQGNEVTLVKRATPGGAA